jgi:hypothetical protein
VEEGTSWSSAGVWLGRKKLLINALSIAGDNNACKMFECYSFSIIASAESIVQHQSRFHTDIQYSMIF